MKRTWPTTNETASSSPDVTVVIVNWNTRSLLQQTLETLHRETHDVTFETIVVDNGSNDGSVELVEQAWKEVQLISQVENRGFAAGNNVGFAKASGRYVLLLNSDTVVLPTTLHGMVSFLDRHSDAGCVGCRHLNPDGTLQRSVNRFPTLLKDFLCYSDLYRSRFLLPFLQQRFPWWGDHDQIREVGWVNGSCMMVRQEVIEEIGGLDEGYFFGAEEIDWCYRMHRCGWRVYFTPEAEVIHLGGQSSMRIVDKRIVLLYKGQFRFYRKHYALWKYGALRLIVGGIAIPRIIILLICHLLSISGEGNKNVGLEILTQESIATEPASMLRAWWKVLWLPWDV